MERLRVKRQTSPTKGRLLSALLTYMPGAWISPSQNELVAVYRQRYRMAVEEAKYDTALIFLNKIIEVDPHNIEAKLCKAEIYHRYLKDYGRAVEQYNKVIRLTADGAEGDLHSRARNSLAEIMELLS